MIPYRTIRDHLDVDHWAHTAGLGWLELVLFHEDEHRSEQRHCHGVAGVMIRSTPTAPHQGSFDDPAARPTLVEDVPTGGAL